MLYFLLGILTIIAFQSILFMKYYERGYRFNKKHMIFSVLFVMYVVFVIQYWHNRVIHFDTAVIGLLFLFVPVGTMMPIIFRRYRAFLMVAVYTCLLDGVILIMQQLTVEKVNILLLLFSLLGTLIGFIISSVICGLFPGFRKSTILKKRKKKILTDVYEIECMTICLALLFLIVSFAEHISGDDLDQKLKDTINYTHHKEKEENPYDLIYYAEKNRYGRYDRYALLHPQLGTEEVVWRVNADLDREFYDPETVVYEDETTDSPLLINKFHRVSDSFEPEKLITIEGEYKATPETVAAYKEMIGDMKEEGLKIYVVSAYRSVSYQKRLYNRYLRSDDQENVDTYSARPGYSEHHTGRALDISQVVNDLNAFEGSEEAEWVYRNAYRYGFIVRYKPAQMDVTGYIFEPWHIVYVGETISKKMQEEHIETLEEYVVKYVDHQHP